MAHVFHVEFGINDTPLTRALENGNYASAERLILDCTNPSYLDEGCYQRTPLHICLCGVDQDAERVIARNFYLARLLIEGGANINHRVPVTYFGSEFLSPGKSCLELLVDYYIDLTSRTSQYAHNCERYGNWSSAADVVVGMDKDYLLTLEDVLDNVLGLIFIVLSNGGDPNMADEKRMTGLHNVCMHSQDVRLLQLLCENGADVNAVDVHGNTPLLALCDLPTAQQCDSFDDFSPTSDDSFSTASAPVGVNLTFLKFLLRIKDVDVNHQNNLGRTALFHCVLRGDADSVYMLLRSGADPNLKGSVWETRKKKRELSPLLTMFLSVPTQRQLELKDTHYCLVNAPRPFAHLVDAGYFSTVEVEGELSELLEQQLPEFSHLRQHTHQLVHLMFGGTTCTLQQLAARQLFKRCLVESTEYLCRILPVATIQQRFSPEDLGEREVYEEYMELVVNHTVLHGLVELLGLPKDTLLHLEVELLLQRLGLQVAGLKVHRPDPTDPAVSDEDASSDDSSYSVSQEEGDSDLEYW
ncbi:hypothetical protein BaRGS_00013958 [Batillaria attramentaria]|uniref:Uncharacterized protein n=1 Tax=Batillaria attramentaria TaxID=370345 RepID=A0ABD0L5K4_9CAEN